MALVCRDHHSEFDDLGIPEPSASDFPQSDHINLGFQGAMPMVGGAGWRSTPAAARVGQLCRATANACKAASLEVSKVKSMVEAMKA